MNHEDAERVLFKHLFIRQSEYFISDMSIKEDIAYKLLQPEKFFLPISRTLCPQRFGSLTRYIELSCKFSRFDAAKEEGARLYDVHKRYPQYVTVVEDRVPRTNEGVLTIIITIAWDVTNTNLVNEPHQIAQRALQYILERIENLNYTASFVMMHPLIVENNICINRRVHAYTLPQWGPRFYLVEKGDNEEEEVFTWRNTFYPSGARSCAHMKIDPMELRELRYTENFTFVVRTLESLACSEVSFYFARPYDRMSDTAVYLDRPTHLTSGTVHIITNVTNTCIELENGTRLQVRKYGARPIPKDRCIVQNASVVHVLIPYLSI
jgi:hypothetical protein